MCDMSVCTAIIELAPVPCDREGALRVREADPRAGQCEEGGSQL